MSEIRTTTPEYKRTRPDDTYYLNGTRLVDATLVIPSAKLPMWDDTEAWDARMLEHEPLRFTVTYTDGMTETHELLKYDVTRLSNGALKHSLTTRLVTPIDNSA